MSKIKLSKIDGLPYEIIDKDYLKWCHESNQGCLICGDTNIHLHHLQSRKLGRLDAPVYKNGTYLRGGIVCLCGNHHNLSGQGIHALGKDTFAKKFYIDLELKAKELWDEYQNK